MAISLLGPLQLDGTDRVSPRDRVVLSALALHAREVVPAERLGDALWGDSPPDSWAKVVQGSVVRLRKALGRQAVQTTSGGYRLVIADEEIDLRRFERLVDTGRRLTVEGEPERAAIALEEALALWRGPALRDVEHWSDGRSELTRLEERRREAEDLLLEARIAAGCEVAALARQLCEAEPLREHRWVLLATTLYRSGRQAEALAAARQARAALRDELGLDAGPELRAVEQAVLRHDRSLQAPEARPVPSLTCPYRGLRSFSREDAEVFFGRGSDVAACVQVLAGSPLLVVVGPSGSGKSSLVRAGVVPAIEDGRSVPVLAPGRSPLSALTTALATPGRARALVVDQAEELFTVEQPCVAREFLERLVELARGGETVLVVVRADAVAGLALVPAFARLVERGLHLLSPLGEDDLRAAVEGPAHLAGLSLEPGLVELLLREVEAEPGALPLLSHALAETWERREAGVLTVAGYRATGGIRSAVARSAEQLYDSLPSGQRTVLRGLLLRLVTASPSGEPVPLRVPLAPLTADADRRAVLELLVRSRLVTTDESTATVAHEALLRAWPRLRSWFDDGADGARVLRHLSVAADDWSVAGRADTDLYRGPRLKAALAWQDAESPSLTSIEADFLRASAGLADAERRADLAQVRRQAQQNRRLRGAIGATAVLLVLAVLAGSLAVVQRQEAAATALDAQIDRLSAQSTALVGSRRDLAALLAVEAHRLRPDAATSGALLDLFTSAPGFMDYRPAPAGVAVADAVLLPGGRTVLTVGVDGVVRRLDGAGATPAPTGLTGGAVLAVAADGATAAAVSWVAGQSGAGHSLLRVYDVGRTERLLHETKLPLDAGSVAVSPKGRYVAVGGYADGRVLVFDLAAQDGVRARPPELSRVGLPALPDGVREVPPVSGAPSTPGSRSTAALAFRPDGSLLVGSEEGTVRAVEPGSGTVLGSLAGPPRTSNLQLALTADGTLVGSGTDGVAAWGASGGLTWTAPMQQGQCGTLALHEPTRAVLCGSPGGAVLTLGLDTGRLAGDAYAVQRGVTSALVVSGGGTTLHAFSATEPVVARSRLDGTGPLTRRLTTPSPAGAYSPDGRLLLLGGLPPGDPPSTPLVVDATSGAVVASLQGYDGAVWTRDPSSVVAWDGGLGFVVDVGTGRRLVELRGGFGEPPTGATTSAGGDALIAWNGRPETKDVLQVWQLGSGEILQAFALHGLSSAELTRDGSIVVAMVGDRLTSRSLDDRVELAGLTDVRFSAVTADDRVVASTGDGRLRVLDARSLTEVGAQPTEAAGRLVALALDGTGRLAAAQGEGGAVRLYDLSTGTSLGEIPGALHPGRLALRPDGRELSVPTDGGTLIWDLDPDHWASAACRLAGRGLTDDEWRTHLGPVAGAGRPCDDG